MSENFSTQFPRPPELHPIPSPQPRFWQIVSLVLIVAGLVLLGVGGWMFYQFQREANAPPPARILEVSVADLTETPEAATSPTRASTSTATRPPAATALSAGAIPPNPTSLPAVSTATLVPELPSVAEINNSPTPGATTPMITLGATDTPVPAATETPLPTPAADEGHSLADNPLVVPDETSVPADVVPAEPAVPLPEVTPVEVSPPTRIVAESIGLDAPVVEVGWQQQMIDGIMTNVWQVADYAAGWHKNSALPGQGGNIVLSGHHNIKGEVFRYVIDMNIGDKITLYVGDQPYQYVVVDKFIVKDKGEPDAVRRENAKWIGPFNEERLTLVTCWPYTNNTHRAIVIARPAGAVQ